MGCNLRCLSPARKGGGKFALARASEQTLTGELGKSLRTSQALNPDL
jgi:hypothetical protein